MAKIGQILAILNTVAIAAVLGLFVYTKLIFKRPQITEKQERARLAQQKTKVPREFKKATLVLDPVTANLDPYMDVDGTQKVHYVNFVMAVEIRDESEVTQFKAAQPKIMDQVLSHLGKKKFEELNQVQGRYVFRSQIIDAANEQLGGPVVSEVYFTEFLLQ